jgi:hypothetical protein
MTDLPDPATSMSRRRPPRRESPAPTGRLWPALPATSRRQLAQQVARLLRPMLGQRDDPVTEETARAERAGGG